MAVEQIQIIADSTQPSRQVACFLEDVDARLDDLVARGLHDRLPNFAPADYAHVHGILATLARTDVGRERFLEWGSALGAVAGMATSLGFRASGIELDAEMVAISRELLDTHGLATEIVEGSFVPDDHEIPDDLDDPDTDTLQPGLAAYDELGRELDEFAVVYAYPWPDMRDAFVDLFDSHAADGAIFVMHEGSDGCRVLRKV